MTHRERIEVLRNNVAHCKEKGWSDLIVNVSTIEILLLTYDMARDAKTKPLNENRSK